MADFRNNKVEKNSFNLLKSLPHIEISENNGLKLPNEMMHSMVIKFSEFIIR